MERSVECSGGKRGVDVKVDAFIEEVIAVCIKHGLSLAHEDSQGSFIVEPADENNFEWLRSASIGRELGAHLT